VPGAGALLVGGYNAGICHVLGSLDSPGNGFQVLCTPKPNPSGSKGTDVAIPCVVEWLLHQYANVGWAACQVSDDGGDVQEGVPHFPMPTQTH
jgi:hypothetical protein